MNNEQIQLELVDRGHRPLAQLFDEWVHTEQGRKVSDKFMRIAYACNERGVKVGAKAIWERLRWHYETAKPEGERYKLNNNYPSYMARFAMNREPKLVGYFDLRELISLRDHDPRKAIVIPIQRKTA